MPCLSQGPLSKYVLVIISAPGQQKLGGMIQHARGLFHSMAFSRTYMYVRGACPALQQHGYISPLPLCVYVCMSYASMSYASMSYASMSYASMPVCRMSCVVCRVSCVVICARKKKKDRRKDYFDTAQRANECIVVNHGMWGTSYTIYHGIWGSTSYTIYHGIWGSTSYTICHGHMGWHIMYHMAYGMWGHTLSTLSGGLT
jgi:hypothetical protein